MDRVVEQGVRVVPDLTSPTQLEAVFAGLLLLQGVGNILLSVVKQFELDTPKSLLITFRPVLL